MSEVVLSHLNDIMKEELRDKRPLAVVLV